MALLESVSGIRGTVGGRPGQNLTPIDLVHYASAYGEWLKMQDLTGPVVLGRDGRISGPLVSALVGQTLLAQGFDIIDLGLTTTPTIEMYIPEVRAQGGIILTASHNPKQWNALKLLNSEGEFLSAQDGAWIAECKRSENYDFAQIDQLGSYTESNNALQHHIEAILDLDLVSSDKIRSQNYRFLVDCINSTGALAIPALLEALGCDYDLLNATDLGHFAHEPEPLEKNLSTTINKAQKGNYDGVIVVDPDVDRLLFLDENGQFIGEEYSLILAADYVLSRQAGTVVNNLSSSRGLIDVAEKYGQQCFSAKVGEAHVVQMMKDKGAVLGGEGNGGIILPALHYGRDALVGIGLILSQMAETGKSLSELRAAHKTYYMSKEKVELPNRESIDQLYAAIAESASGERIDRQDGVKISFPSAWVQIRASNTEPILRLYTEADSAAEADRLAQKYKSDVLQKLKEI